MKLISNTLFGDYLRSRKEEFKTRLEYLEWYYELRSKYDKFLSQPLKLEMFVPCDEGGNVLEEPESLKGYYETDKEGMETERKLREQYQKAKERCLFIIKTLPKISELELLIDDETIELLTIGNDVELTPTAIKKIGL